MVFSLAESLVSMEVGESEASTIVNFAESNRSLCKSVISEMPVYDVCVHVKNKIEGGLLWH